MTMRGGTSTPRLFGRVGNQSFVSFLRPAGCRSDSVDVIKSPLIGRRNLSGQSNNVHTGVQAICSERDREREMYVQRAVYDPSKAKRERERVKEMGGTGEKNRNQSCNRCLRNRSRNL